MMQIIKYYKIALLPSSLITISIEIVWGIIDYDPNYKSEWLTPGVAIIWSIVLVIINALIISTLSLTIFLNDCKNVRYRLFLSLITWFLAPMIWIGYFLHRAFLLIIERSSGDWDFLLLNTIPYLIGLVWGFAKFRLDMKKV